MVSFSFTVSSFASVSYKVLEQQRNCCIKLKAKSFKVEWNEFTEDAWYV